MPAYIPDLQVHVRQRDCGDILADGRDGVACCSGGRRISLFAEGRVYGGVEEGFYLAEEGGFARIVEAEKDDGVFL